MLYKNKENIFRKPKLRELHNRHCSFRGSQKSQNGCCEGTGSQRRFVINNVEDMVIKCF